MAISVGQVWREDDKRFDRRIRVVAVTVDSALIENVQTGRRTLASLSRFGRSGGYKLMESPPSACGRDVPPKTTHECERTGGVTTVRNRPGFQLGVNH